MSNLGDKIKGEGRQLFPFLWRTQEVRVEDICPSEVPKAV